MEEQNFRLMSININGFSTDKIQKLTNIGDFDLLLIQETHNSLTDVTKDKLERELDCIIIRNNYVGIDTKGGVASFIKIKKGRKWERIDEGEYFKGRMIHLRIGDINFINIYMPPKRNLDFAVKLMEYLEKYTTGNLIIGGDFNWVGDQIDRRGQLTANDKQLKGIMEKIMESQNLIDIYRKLNMLRVDYTYTINDKGVSRIDKFWGTYFGTINYKTSGIEDFKLSDHKLIYLEIGIRGERIKWGRGSWKLNNKILGNKDFIEEIQKEIKDFINKGNINIIEEWDNLKVRFRKIAIKHSLIKAKKYKLEREAMENYIKTITDQNIKKTLQEDLDKKKRKNTIGEGR